MKTFLLLVAGSLSGACWVGTAVAQNPVSTPSTPAPAVTLAADPTGPLPAPNRIIYGQRLPTPDELRNIGAAQGLTLDRIEQTDSQIVAVYRTASGQTTVTSYQILSASGGVAPGQTATTVVVPSAPPSTTVIYDTPREVVYYDPYYYWPWYSPIRVGVGLGFSYRGGGYYHRGIPYHGGGFYHGGGWHGGGGRSFGHR